MERRKVEQREESLKKEMDSVKREKERLCERYAEMDLALKEVTEELRQTKENGGAPGMKRDKSGGSAGKFREYRKVKY